MLLSNFKLDFFITGADKSISHVGLQTQQNCQKMRWEQKWRHGSQERSVQGASTLRQMVQSHPTRHGWGCWKPQSKPLTLAQHLSDKLRSEGRLTKLTTERGWSRPGCSRNSLAQTISHTEIVRAHSTFQVVSWFTLESQFVLKRLLRIFKRIPWLMLDEIGGEKNWDKISACIYVFQDFWEGGSTLAGLLLNCCPTQDSIKWTSNKYLASQQICTDIYNLSTFF